MIESIQQHTPEALAEVVSGAKHLDVFEILQDDIDFVESMRIGFGGKPSKEEDIVIAKHKKVLDNKIEFIDQALKVAGLTNGSGKAQYSDLRLLKQFYNVTILVSKKEEG
jgi:hypothetical protein